MGAFGPSFVPVGEKTGWESESCYDSLSQPFFPTYWVDGSLRGQGVSGQLLRAVADTLRQDGRKARVTCSYAIHWFETHPEEQDLLG